jgi:hypothetical protein
LAQLGLNLSDRFGTDVPAFHAVILGLLLGARPAHWIRSRAKVQPARAGRAGL